MSNYLFISDAAKEVNVESHVLRYWEEELHLPIKRNELGHRYYTQEDVERFKQIKGMKERGLQLKAIKMILKDGKLDMLIPKGEAAEKTENTAVQQEAVEVQKSVNQKNQEQAETNINQKEQPQAEHNINQPQAQETEKKIHPQTQEETGRTAVNQEVPEEAEKIIKQEETAGNSNRRNQAPQNIQARKRTERVQTVPHVGIDVVETKGCEVSADSKEDKSRRLQWLLQQLIRETLQENNGELCREIKESVVKELDYQFRMQEEREDARDRLQEVRNEEHYRRMDELLRKKARKAGKERSRERKKIEKAEIQKEKGNLQKPSKTGIERVGIERSGIERPDMEKAGSEKKAAMKIQEEIPTVNVQKADKKKRHFIF